MKNWTERLEELPGYQYSMWIGVGIGLFLRFCLGLVLYPDFLKGDAEFYVSEAVRLASGHPPGSYWPPLLIFYLSFFAKLGFSEVWVGLLGASTVWILFSWTWEQVGSRWLKSWQVNLGHLIWAIYPAFIYQSIVSLSYLPLAVLLLWYADSLFRQNAKPFYLSALLLGLMVLLRPGSLLLGILIPIFFIRKNFSWKRWLLAGFLFFLPIVIWEVSAYQTHNRWLRINDANAYNFFLGNHPYTPDYRTWWLGSHDERGNPEFIGYYTQLDSIRELPLTLQQDAYQEIAWAYIGEKPGIFLRRAGSRIRTFWAFDSLSGGALHQDFSLISYFMIAGNILLYSLLIGFLGPFLFRLEKLDLLGCIIFIVAYLLPYLLAFSHPTYHLPLIPFIALFAFSGLNQRKKAIPEIIKWLYRFIFAIIQIEWVLDLLDRS